MKRKNTTPVYFEGWIYGNIDDKETLRKLGVVGKMIWKPSDNTKSVTPGANLKTGVFEYCTITMETAKRLRDSYQAFTPQTFTGIDIDGNQTIYQPLWKGDYE